MMLYLRRLAVEWNVCRVVRIIAGLPILIMGLRAGDWTSIVFGAAFISLGLFTTQCCSSGNCDTHYRKPARKDLVVEFEEIKNNV